MPIVWLMAVACSVSIGGNYYAQPLLDLLAHTLNVSSVAAASVVTVTQLGFITGLVFLVPLGDFFNRRALVSLVTLGACLSLACAALAPGFYGFLAASFLLGLTATSAQIIVTAAAHLAADAQRGAVVGRVMSGLLVGILLARAFSGLIADAAGWRAVFGCAALAMLVQAVVLYRALPDTQATGTRMSYAQLLRSIGVLLVEEAALRRRSIYGALGLASFTILWTTLPFLLAPAPYGYSETTIGLFSLLGAAGAVGASLAGSLHDAGHNRIGTVGFISIALVSFVIMGLAPHSLAAIAIGILAMDFGVQGVHILNQGVIYARRSEARSRITTAYMGCLFFGGAAGSLLAGITYDIAGWPGAMATAGLLEVAALVFWCTEFRSHRLIKTNI